MAFSSPPLPVDLALVNREGNTDAVSGDIEKLAAESTAIQEVVSLFERKKNV